MKRTKLVLFVLALSLILTACGERAEPTDVVMADTAVPTAAPTLTPTSIPPKVLNVCMVNAPTSLYRYDGNDNAAKMSVYAILYPDLLSVDPQSQQAIFFESIPGEENGGVQLLVTQVKVGMPVQNASGQVVYLEEGIQIEHAINYSLENPVVWDHEQDYHMNQFQVTFKLRPELKWSDGSPLTAQDFVYSYHLAEQTGLGKDKWALDRTESFVALDAQTLVWTGVPGFVPKNLGAILWKPMPEKALLDLPEDAAGEIDLRATVPLSWGPYRFQALQGGSGQNLEKNPHFILGSNFAGFDLVRYITEPSLEAALEKLRSGECHILDKSYGIEGLAKSELEILAVDFRLIGENWKPVQQLVFGINPAVYDTGFYNAWTTERQDILGNLETRRALEACINPGGLVRGYFNAHLPESVAIPEEYYNNGGLDGNAALEAIGWAYPEGGATDVRSAENVVNVLNGTELRLGLLTGQSQMDLEVAEVIRSSLGACGIAVEVQSLPVEQLYQPGPDGLIFGRKFDLALVAWQTIQLNACQLYTSDQMPASINSWVGTNTAGYKNTEFDLGCWASSGWLVGGQQSSPELMQSHLPAVELMPQYHLWAVAPGVSLPEGANFADVWRFMPEE